MSYQDLNPKKVHGQWYRQILRQQQKWRYQIRVNNYWGDEVRKDMQQRVHREYLWEERLTEIKKKC